MGWIVEQGTVRASELEGWCEQVERELDDLAGRYMARFVETEHSGPSAERSCLVNRLWSCIAYHWRSSSNQHHKSFAAMVQTLETAETGETADAAGVLHEVALAVALEAMQPKAATQFETAYMPKVRHYARQVAGPRGEDLVEGFAATLVMPRQDAPPRIRQFQGRTSLLKWLRVVVTNYCLSQLRRKQGVSIDAAADAVSTAAPLPLPDNGPCVALLSPAIAAAVGKLSPDDRLLIKLLVLEEAPQHQVAKSLGIHSGNVTRRKQKIIDAIWNGMDIPPPGAERSAEFRDCLGRIVAGNDPLLAGELAGLVAAAVSGPASPDARVAPGAPNSPGTLVQRGAQP
jgi:RNA polymerase sigma factor (sigma-70 family)